MQSVSTDICVVIYFARKNIISQTDQFILSWPNSKIFALYFFNSYYNARTRFESISLQTQHIKSNSEKCLSYKCIISSKYQFTIM